MQTNMETHTELSEAKIIIEQKIKDGTISREYVESLTDEEYIQLADKINSYDEE